MPRLYVVRVTGAPAAGPLNEPVVRAKHASGVRAAVGRVLDEIEDLEEFLKKGHVTIHIRRERGACGKEGAC